MTLAHGQRYSLFQHLSTAFWPNLNGREALFMVYGITAYYDASSKEEVLNEPLAVVGVAAPVHKWDAFERDWAAVLEKHGVEYFDAAGCSSWRGEPYKYWNRDNAKRDAFLLRLAEILRDTASKVAMASIVPADFQEVNKLYMLDEDEHWPSPYPLATHWCLNWIQQDLATSPFSTPGYEVAHVIEKGDTGQGVIQKLIEREVVPISIQEKWNKTTNRKLHAFAACDLMAHYGRKALKVSAAGERKRAPNVVGVFRQIQMPHIAFSRQTLIQFCESHPTRYPRRAA